MADELDEADTQVRDHAGFENDSVGKLLGIIIRRLRVLTNQVRDLKARVDRLDPP